MQNIKYYTKNNPNNLLEDNLGVAYCAVHINFWGNMLNNRGPCAIYTGIYTINVMIKNNIACTQPPHVWPPKFFSF